MMPVEPWIYLPDYRFGASTGATGGDNVQHRGILYHRKVYKMLHLQAAIARGGAGAEPSSWRLLVEPWFKAKKSQRLRSPDSVLLAAADGIGLVIEVKLNWKDGRDDKLIDEYLPIVRSAFGVRVKPLLITRNLRGYQHPPLLGLSQLAVALDWTPGQPTPLMLLP